MQQKSIAQCVFLFFIAAVQIGTAAKPYIPSAFNPDEHLSIHSISELSSYDCLSITEGTSGNIWIGTHNDGVLEYNGLKFINRGLRDLPIHAILETSGGDVYAGCDPGIFKKTGNNWKKVFPPENSFSYVTKLIEHSNGTIWAATHLGAVKISGGKITLYSAPETIRRLNASWTQNISFVEVPESLLHKQKNTGNVFTLPSISTDGSHYIIAVSQDADADIIPGKKAGSNNYIPESDDVHFIKTFYSHHTM